MSIADQAPLAPLIIPAHLTVAEKAQLYELLALRERKAREDQLSRYRPYPKQQEFHRQGAAYRERLFMAGNQLGKCRLVSSVVQHPGGGESTMGELWERGSAFDVWAWDGERAVSATVSHFMRKPAEECVELLLADGTMFSAALGHQVLTRTGYACVGQLIACVPAVPAIS